MQNTKIREYRIQKIENANTSYDVPSSIVVLKVSKNRLNVIMGTSRDTVNDIWDFSKMSDEK